MACTKCGATLPTGALYCPKCGLQQQVPLPREPLPETPEERWLRKGLYFLDNYLAFVAVGVLAVITVILFAVGSQGFTSWSATNVAQQFCLVGALALAALVSTRTGGLDISIGGMMALSAMIFAMYTSADNPVAGFLMALVICVALGFLNGLFIMVLRIPSLLVTVASAMLIRGISLWASNGITIDLPPEWEKMSTAAPVLALCLSVGIAIFLLWRTGGFSRNKKSIYGKVKFFWIYGLIAVIGVLAGWAAAICFGSASAGIGSGSSNEMILLFIFAVISASGLLKSNWTALAWVLLMAILWTIHDQAMILLQLNPFSMIVSNASWVFILLAVMSIAKHSWKKPMWETLNP